MRRRCVPGPLFGPGDEARPSVSASMLTVKLKEKQFYINEIGDGSNRIIHSGDGSSK